MRAYIQIEKTISKYKFSHKIGLLKDEEAQFFRLDYSRLDSNAKLA